MDIICDSCACGDSVPHTSLFSCQLSVSRCKNPFCQLPFSLIGHAYTCKLGQCLSDRICHSTAVTTLSRTATSLSSKFVVMTFRIWGFLFFIIIFFPFPLPPLFSANYRRNYDFRNGEKPQTSSEKSGQDDGLIFLPRSAPSLLQDVTTAKSFLGCAKII